MLAFGMVILRLELSFDGSVQTEEFPSYVLARIPSSLISPWAISKTFSATSCLKHSQYPRCRIVACDGGLARCAAEIPLRGCCFLSGIYATIWRGTTIWHLKTSRCHEYGPPSHPHPWNIVPSGLRPALNPAPIMPRGSRLSEWPMG